MTDLQLARFESKFAVEPNSGCWLWFASHKEKGYGQLRQDGVIRLAHRVSYEHFVGPIPDGLQIDHLCSTPECVNPEHLDAVTPVINVRRSRSSGEARRTWTRCRRGHIYGMNARLDSSGHRICLTCRRASGRSGYASQ